MPTSEFSEYQPKTPTPGDFPKRNELAALNGNVQKFSARLINGRYTVGATAEEHRERYLDCCSLVADLITYCHRKQAADVKWTPEALHERIKQGLENTQELDLTVAELQWVLVELWLAMQWPNTKHPD